MKICYAFLLLLWVTYSYAQYPSPTKKFSAQQQRDDLAFLEKQLFDAHANPYTELSKQQYEQFFDSVRSQIKDSADVTTFYKLIKPAFAHLSDEHSAVSIDPAQLTSTYKTGAVFLPITLLEHGNDYTIGQLLSASTTLKPGDKIVAIDREPITLLVKRCAAYTTGYPGQRHNNALAQFGYLYTWAAEKPEIHYTITTADGKTTTIDGTDLQTWRSYLNANNGMEPCDQMISYTRYNNAGYIKACSFMTHSNKQYDSLKTCIDGIFRHIKSDGIKYLFIDVSKNGGGNSQVGDVLIDYIYSKPYLGYQCNWRRSDEYLKLITKWGITDSNYIAHAPGSVLHFDAYKNVPSTQNASRFNGKVYVIIGNGTFSSAMMFATVIKDNHIATLIGQTPQNGHPDHFGELYNSELPNTKLSFRFGVKEWIRPAGKQSDNYLKPDEVIDPNTNSNPQQLIEAATK